MLTRIVALIGAGLLLAACHKTSPGSLDSAAAVPSPYDVNKYAVNKTVCNPLGGSTATSSEPSQGLHASLWYLQSNQTPYHDVESMINYGHASSEQLFFSELFVPTRLFTEGFPLQSGGSIVNDAGQELIEYFALRFDGLLHLGPNDAEGDYQLGMLSDDGTIWSLSEDGVNYDITLNNDGDHPTQMGCGPIVHMTQSTVLAMKLDYYQGPRYHIALVPMWRRVNTSPTPNEPLCGQNGNSLYFDYNNNSAPEPAFNQLLSRGWYPLGVQNYSVSASTTFNPCTSGTPPVISNVTAINDMETGPYYVITWTTDIPATDQVLYTDQATGTQVLTTSDNLLNTGHAVLITVQPGHTYTVEAVSISADLGKTISPPITVTVH